MAIDLNKAKVEKQAKHKERSLVNEITTDNKSVLRACARQQAAIDMYPEAPLEEINEALLNVFYKNAKYQPSWDAAFEKHAPSLGALLKASLGAPSPRGRRAKKIETAPPPANQDPDALLAPQPDGE